MGWWTRSVGCIYLLVLVPLLITAEMNVTISGKVDMPREELYFFKKKSRKDGEYLKSERGREGRRLRGLCNLPSSRKDCIRRHGRNPDDITIAASDPVTEEAY